MKNKPSIPHTPGPSPVPDDTIVIVEMEDGDMLSPLRADQVDWNCPGDQIVSYTIANPRH